MQFGKQTVSIGCHQFCCSQPLAILKVDNPFILVGEPTEMGGIS